MPRPREHPDEIVLETPARVRRSHELKMTGLFLLAGVPVALILAAIVGKGVAVGYLIAQTLFLWFGLHRRQLPVLRLNPEQISYESGRFQLKCAWADVDALGEANLPEGKVDALFLASGQLNWAADQAVMRQTQAKGWDRIIPIGSFEPEWEWGKIGAAIREWAPWVFELDPPADQK